MYRDVEEEAQRYRSSGDALQACGRGDAEASSTLEACYACSDVEETQRFGALEMCCSRMDIEEWRSGALKACCTYGDAEEAQRFGALEVRCSRMDIEVWRSGALEARCRRVDVEM